MWIRAGSSPSASSERARKGPFRSVRSPRTSSLPVTTITARGRAAAWFNLAPGSTRVGGEDLLRGHEDALRLDRWGELRAVPVQLHEDVPRRLEPKPEHLAVEPLALTLLERALVENVPDRAARPDDHVRVASGRTQLQPGSPGRLLNGRRHRGRRIQPMDVLVRRVAEPPGRDHERREKADCNQREENEVRLPPLYAPGSSGGHPSRRADGAILLADNEARVVLIDVELSVE